MCIVLSLLVGIAEVPARSVVEARLAETSMRILHAKADVSLGGPPAVAQLAKKHFPDVHMSVDDASFGQISDSGVHEENAEVDIWIRDNGEWLGRVRIPRQVVYCCFLRRLSEFAIPASCAFDQSQGE
ncbi:hypothetical protein AB0H36_11890 [Kribbella sp. NPDC050820]|uniref:hypothetical protein n=1 Tax=Kribbella sp. NPDC050820 TaxID=3155408 RepID=UPI0034068F37